MTSAQAQPAAFAAQLRREFDQAFSLPAQAETATGRHLLAIRIGEQSYVLDPAEITGLQVDRPIIRVPGALQEWLGLAGIRGGLVPVYSLAVLLGHQAPAVQPRWLALCGSGQSLGLAFDEFERHLNLEPSQIAAVDPAHTRSEHVRAIARAQDVSRPIIGIPSIASEIARRCATVIPSKEK